MTASQEIFHVAGKKALITGGASGLGLAFAEALVANGAQVHLIDNNPQTLQEALERLGAGKGSVSGSCADVTDLPALEKAISTAITGLGGLNIVFANAGISGGYGPGAGPEGRIEALDRALWSRALDVNLNGVLHTLQAVVPTLRAQGQGKIIITASIAGVRANTHIGYGYTASKSALVNLTKVLALELAPFGVQVNAIAPGLFLTHINGSRFHDPDNALRASLSNPQKRIALPEEIKGVALLLASRASDFITGSVLTIDGGATAGS